MTGLGAFDTFLILVNVVVIGWLLYAGYRRAQRRQASHRRVFGVQTPTWEAMMSCRRCGHFDSLELDPAGVRRDSVTTDGDALLCLRCCQEEWNRQRA